MKLKLLAAAATGLLAPSVWAVDLGLDAACAYNGTDQGVMSWNGDSYRRCDLPSEIAVDGTVALPKSYEGSSILWALPSTVTVGNGHQLGATPSTTVATVLEIEPGTQVAGAPHAALVITRGSELFALGSDVEPIVFSSLDDDFSGSAEWGGVVLSSWDSSNACNAGLGDECVMDGVRKPLFEDFDGSLSIDDIKASLYYYGGYIDDSSTAGWDHVSSGVLEYVVIAESGSGKLPGLPGMDSRFLRGGDLNGLTLYAVSNETYIRNVHVHNSSDDALQLFGGDVGVDRLWLTCAGDDSVDWDEGFHGDLSNVSILQKDGADHAFELSNNMFDYEAEPVSNGNVYGVTIAYDNDGPYVDVPFRLKEGTDGTFTNVSIASDYTGACFGNLADPRNYFAVTSSDFNSIEYSCVDNVGGLLPASSSAFGFTDSSFWAGYPASCD